MPSTPELLLLIGAIFAGIVSVINALKNRRIEDGLAEVKTVAAVIEGHVDGAATAAKMRDEAGQKERESLVATINELKATAVALATATASHSNKEK